MHRKGHWSQQAAYLILDAHIAAEGGGRDTFQLQPLRRLLRRRLVDVRDHHLRALMPKARRARIADALGAACETATATMSGKWVGSDSVTQMMFAVGADQAGMVDGASHGCHDK
jgi:hypothetical protein